MREGPIKVSPEHNVVPVEIHMFMLTELNQHPDQI